MRDRRVRATRRQLPGPEPGGTPIPYDPWLTDDFVVHAAFGLRLAALPSLSMGSTPPDPWVAVAEVVATQGQARPMLVSGTTAAGGVVSLLMLDRDLEAGVFARSSEGRLLRFEDWAQAARQVTDDSGTHVVRIRTIGRSPDTAHLFVESFALDATRFPPVPKPETVERLDEIPVALSWLDEAGKPIADPSDVDSEPRILQGVLSVPTRDRQKTEARFLRCTFKDEDHEQFETVVPLPRRSLDTEFSLRVDSSLDTSLVLYSELVLDALRRRDRDEAATRAIPQGSTSPRPDAEIVRGFVTAPADGIALGIDRGRRGDRLVIPCRLELPLTPDTESDGPSRPGEAATWIEDRARQVFETDSHRGWLIVSLLLGSLGALVGAWHR